MATSCTSCARCPGWQDTVVLFLSDDGGYASGEHGGLYHLTPVFDEQVRVPGWLLAGDHVSMHRSARR